MEKRDTKILIDNNDSKRSDVAKDDSVDGNQDFIAKLRHYNRQGPHFLYGSTLEPNRKPKPVQRLIRKSGKYNVSRNSKSEIWDKYLRDLSHTLVNSRWRWTIIASTSSFILSWLLFGLIWMLISNANGDVELQNPSSTPCLSGIRGFAGYFLFSLETQATIGYGSRYISHHCPEAVFILCLQIIMGCAICGLMVNIVYLKLMKPLKKYSERLFSKHAVICRRDGELCLIFRVRDEDAKHAVSTVVNAYLLRKEKGTEEPCLETLSIEPHGFLIWPLEIVHKITKTSPLWDISSYDLISDRFEIIVQLQGTSPTTGQCNKTRTSYLSSEILWGHRFTRCVKYAHQHHAYVISHKDFNVTQEHSIHLCSAKRFVEVFKYINPNYTTSPDLMLHPKKIEINIVHSNRVNYLPAQSIDKLDDSSLANKRDSVCDEETVVAEDSEKRCSFYEGITPDEVDENSKLLPKFNFDDVALSESESLLVRQSPVELSPGYDNVSLEIDKSHHELPRSGTPLVVKSKEKEKKRSLTSVDTSLGSDVTLETDRASHTRNYHQFQPSPDEVFPVGANKFGSYKDIPRNNSLTLAVPFVPKSKSYHQFRPCYDEEHSEIIRVADVGEFPRNNSLTLAVPSVSKSNNYQKFQPFSPGGNKLGHDEVPSEVDWATEFDLRQDIPRNNSLTFAPKSKSDRPGNDEVPLDVENIGFHQSIPLCNCLRSAVIVESCHQCQYTKNHSSQISFGSSGISKADVSSEEIMDLDAILAYLEEYLEKNGKTDAE